MHAQRTKFNTYQKKASLPDQFHWVIRGWNKKIDSLTLVVTWPPSHGYLHCQPSPSCRTVLTHWWFYYHQADQRCVCVCRTREPFLNILWMPLGCPHPSQGCRPVIHQPGLPWMPPVCPCVLHALPGIAEMTFQGEKGDRVPCTGNMNAWTSQGDRRTRNDSAVWEGPFVLKWVWATRKLSRRVRTASEQRWSFVMSLEG